jgi:PHP family Zn ribbon phosphoesterase
MHRVEKLADRNEGEIPPGKIPYKNLIPLNEIIGQATGKTAECRSVWEIYFRFIHEFGDEHTILTEVPIEQLARLSPKKVSQGIARMRQGKVNIIPGHDGVYGKINLFADEEEPVHQAEQLKLF